MHDGSWHTCPRCGLRVYKSAWADHDRRCLLVEARFGSPRRMVEVFRDETSLTPAALAARVSGVGSRFITDVLVAGGVSYAEIDGRAAPRYAPRPPRACLCRRCEVRLDARGVRPSAGDETLCAWCAAEMAAEAALAERGGARWSCAR
jgi:hypothetical protein